MTNLEYQFEEPTTADAELYESFFNKKMNFSLNTLKKAVRVDVVDGSKFNVKRQDFLEKIESVSFVVKETKRGKAIGSLWLKINGEEYKMSSLAFHFSCEKCGKIKIINTNPARDLVNFKSLLCEVCYKSSFYKSEEYSSRYKKTMIERYGAESPLQSKEISDKIRKTMIERYGVPFSAMNSDLYKKSQNTTKERYGDSKLFGSSLSERIFTDEVAGFLSERGFQDVMYYKTEVKKVFVEKRRFFVLDFFIPKLNLAIEFFGDYFHGNPEIYKEDYLVSFKRMTRIELNNKDKERVKILKALGIDVFIVWENDWKTKKQKVLANLEETINEINNNSFTFRFQPIH